MLPNHPSHLFPTQPCCFLFSLPIFHGTAGWYRITPCITTVFFQTCDDDTRHKQEQRREHVQHVRSRAREPSCRWHGAALRVKAVRWRQGGDGPVVRCADTYALAQGPPPVRTQHYAYQPVPTYSRHRAAGALRCRTLTSFGRAVPTAYRGTTGGVTLTTPRVHRRSSRGRARW